MKPRVCVVLLLFSGLFVPDCCSGQDAPDCYPDRGSCIRKVGGREVTFSLAPRPVKVMKDLVFQLVLNPAAPSPAEIIVSLSMPGMYMGENRVVLRQGTDGIFRGKGVIPRCRSGRKLWKATADIPGVGRVDFSFDVSY